MGCPSTAMGCPNTATSRLLRAHVGQGLRVPAGWLVGLQGLVLGILLLGTVIGQDQQQLFRQANRFYEEGAFDRALSGYREILSQGYESGPLYFNVGNCYYKLGQIGKAVLFYERARRLIPGDEDLQANLALANLRVVDKIPELPEFWPITVANGLINLLSRPVLLGVTFSLYFFFIASIIVRTLARRRAVRSVGGRSAILGGALLLLFGLFLVAQIQQAQEHNRAVVMVSTVHVMSAPGAEGVEVFTLHEGTRVRIDQTSGQWVEIVLSDGNVGWLKAETLEVI